MRINNTTNINSAADNQKGKVTKIIIAFLVLCTMFCFTVQAQNDSLDEESAAALVQELADGLEAEIEDEDTFNSILNKWGSRNLIGKTRKQAIDILFADVKAVVKDTGITNKLWTSWSSKTEETKPVETSKENPREETPKPVVQNPSATPVNRSTPEGMIEIGRPPLSEAQMTEVMKWIAVKVGAEKLPFCWKQSYGRTAGTPMTCKSGYNQDTAGLCYQQCKPNERGIATFCYKNCPEGLPDNGLYCEKRGEYGRGAGYPIWDKGKCEKENPQGCEQSGALHYPKCKPGYAPFGCCLCKPACPQGWEDIGVSCKKPNYARAVLPLSECPAGTEKNGALCYPKCTNDFSGKGPVCWQNCPSQQSWDCGAACSTNQKECGFAVANMVTAPIIAAVNIASLGSAAAATAPAKAAQIGATVSKLGAAVSKVKTALTAAKGSIEVLVGGAQNLAKIQKVVEIGGKFYKVYSAVGNEIDLFSKEFADNFEDMTSPEIAREIDKRFKPEAAYQIKREWGARHLMMNLEANGFATAKNVLTLASAADPTGLVAVANAFMHPVCKADTPFPTVNPIY